jgi:hypothetical protein
MQPPKRRVFKKVRTIDNAQNPVFLTIRHLHKFSDLTFRLFNDAFLTTFDQNSIKGKGGKECCFRQASPVAT